MVQSKATLLINLALHRVYITDLLGVDDITIAPSLRSWVHSTIYGSKKLIGVSENAD